MSEEQDQQWAAFETLGPEQVRKNLGAKVYGEPRERMAIEWLAHKMAGQESEDRQETLKVAQKANDISRRANDLAKEANATAVGAASAAKEAADATRASARIAAGALVMAFLALVVSVLGTIMK